jgi:phosphoribosyl 1,2-cyclic phosphodiesterase
VLQFVPLASGSQGNALVVQAGFGGAGASRVMLDCGLGLRDCCERLKQAGLAPQDLSAIVVTHEHGDHVSGAFKLARKFSIPVFLTHGSFKACEKDAFSCDITIVCSHTPFALGDLQITPHPVPHDAREPVQYSFTDGTRKLAVLTDLGKGTALVSQMLAGSDAIVMECNHDAAMLEASGYPYSLKRRIAGPFGHLSNDAAAAILASSDLTRLKRLFAAHLSQSNNTHALAQAALSTVTGGDLAAIGVLDQNAPGTWVDV